MGMRVEYIIVEDRNPYIHIYDDIMLMLVIWNEYLKGKEGDSCEGMNWKEMYCEEGGYLYYKDGRMKIKIYGTEEEMEGILTLYRIDRGSLKEYINKNNIEIYDGWKRKELDERNMNGYMGDIDTYIYTVRKMVRMN